MMGILFTCIVQTILLNVMTQNAQDIYQINTDIFCDVSGRSELGFTRSGSQHIAVI